MILAFLGFVSAAVLASVAAAFLASPRLAPGGAYFGLPVERAYVAGPAARATEARYRRRVWLGTAASVAIVAGGLATTPAIPWPFLAGVLLQGSACTAAWMAARREVLPHAMAAGGAQRRAALVQPASPSPLADLPGFALLAGAGAVLGARWEALPARFAVHFGPGGPDGFAERTPAGVFGPLVLGAGLLTLLVALRWLLHALAPSGATPRARALHAATGWFLAGVGWLVGAAFAAAALLPFTGGPWLVLTVVGIGLVAVLVAPVLGTLRVLRLPPDPPDPAGVAGSDAGWRAGGLVYANPGDPALWVTRRTGLGYTLNFGHRRAWLVLGALLSPVVVAVLAALLR